MANQGDTEQTHEFCQPDVLVRLIDNPSRRGNTTGKCRRIGTRLNVEVSFGPNECVYKDVEVLERDSQTFDPYEEVERGNFGTEKDLRRMLVLEKLQGRLTNVFYSMETSNTDFYPHQFKPVLKFMESPTGRLLIADEVGLGKTIEAGFIWKELQVRETARRLLIVCPAILVQKWKDDLAQKFSIYAEDLDVKGIVNRLEGFLENGAPNEFALIGSLEGLRTPSSFEDEENKRYAARLGRLLERNPATEERAVLDLTIIDEAHYLRTVGTNSNRLGNLLRDASNHLLLLTATPIQINSDNLYQLLRIISPEDFFNKQVFDEILQANEPVTRALRCLWNLPPDMEGAHTGVNEALTSSFFANNRNLAAIEGELIPGLADDRSRKIEIGNILERASLLGHFMSRSRKRDALENRVERSAQTQVVRFTEEERHVYDYVTEQVRQRSEGLYGVSLFSVIARQTQMASCMVAAIESWRSGGFLDDLLFDAMGLDSWSFGGVETNGETEDGGLNVLEIPDGVVDLALLEQNDSKYAKLLESLNELLSENPNEKFVIFAFFRGTLEYLYRRLKADGKRTCLIMGGMGDVKWDVIREFAEPDGPNILLSSEVGSEGIDLQFCRVLVNYDLPWNPMRVEQRIGRLDRLGQKAERITIINLSLEDTIEERILSRLYQRIELFRESIGDLEEILGEMTENLILELFKPGLTDSEREAKADEIADAIIKKRADQVHLESEAINLVAYSDFILDSIKEGRDVGRWLKPEELQQLVADFLYTRFPGSHVGQNTDDAETLIELSEQAKISLRSFKMEHRLSVPTRLDQSSEPVRCAFNPKRSTVLPKSVELVDPSHPLLAWVRAEYEGLQGSFHPTAAIRIKGAQVDLEPGLYAFAVHEWAFIGLRTEVKLVHRVARVFEGNCFDQERSEKIIGIVASQGEMWPNARNLIENYDAFLGAVACCDENILNAYDAAEEQFKADNDNRCDVQEESARRFAKRRLEDFERRLDRFRETGKTRMVPATEGLVRNEKANLDVKLKRIVRRRGMETEWRPLCFGVVLVE
jgi:superfamily II DNA or RNA helicase